MGRLTIAADRHQEGQNNRLRETLALARRLFDDTYGKLGDFLCVLS